MAPPDGEHSEQIVSLVILSKGGKPANYDHQLAQAHQAIQTGTCPHGDGVLSLALLNASQCLLDGQALMRDVSYEETNPIAKANILKFAKGK